VKSAVAALVAGLLFGIGLILAGMTEPAKVLAFLDLAGDWDPSLGFVMAGAIGVHALLYRQIRRRSAPLFDRRFFVPDRRDLDLRLVAGAAIFGVGWGLGGFCPGPGLVGAAGGTTSALAFAGAMTVGMWLQQVVAGPAPSGR
jgi:uncharacterized protein